MRESNDQLSLINIQKEVRSKRNFAAKKILTAKYWKKKPIRPNYRHEVEGNCITLVLYDQVQIAANNTCHQVCILSDLFCYGPITRYKNDSVESYHLNNNYTSINYCCSAEGGHIKKIQSGLS